MRSSIIAALVFFSLAPLAFAGNLPGGAACEVDSDCQSNNCQFTLAKTCAPVSVDPGNSLLPIQCTALGQVCTTADGITNGTCVTNIGPTSATNPYFCSAPQGGTSGVLLQSSPTITPPPAAQTGGGVSGGSSGGTTGVSGGQSGNTGPGKSITLINPLNLGGSDCSKNNTCLSVFLNDILDLVVNIGSIVVILMLIFVGYKFVMAQGEPGKITEARSMLLWTVVGALILLGAKAIAIGIQATVQALSVGK